MVSRRREREAKERLTRPESRRFKPKPGAVEKANEKAKKDGIGLDSRVSTPSKKRKRAEILEEQGKKSKEAPKSKETLSKEEKNKLAMRNRIIGRKRMARKARKGGQ